MFIGGKSRDANAGILVNPTSQHIVELRYTKVLCIVLTHDRLMMAATTHDQCCYDWYTALNLPIYNKKDIMDEW